MKRVLFVLLFLVATLFAKVDYSVMSTQELMAMIGYVPAKNQKAFKKEVDLRVKSMSAKEKEIYKKNLEKLKK